MTQFLQTKVLDEQVEACREMIDLGMGIEDDHEFIEEVSKLQDQVGDTLWSFYPTLVEDEFGPYEYDDTAWSIA